MTDQEAIAKAQKELDMANYFAETSSHAGLRAVHSNRAEWLTRVLHLAREVLHIAENPKQPKTNADRIRAMSDEKLAELLVEEKEYGVCHIPFFRCPGGKDFDEDKYEDALQYTIDWLKQPAEE